ncbi:MAG: AAA family ATPase [Myxococcales bacterium]
MGTLRGYEIRDRLYVSGNKSVLRVRRERDGFIGVLKYFDTDAQGHAELERIKNEFECLKAVRSACVIRVHELVFFERGVGILMDDFGGEALSALLERKARLDLASFLELAVRLVVGVRDIHRERVIHRDLKPSNVLVDEATWELRIIDFGISKAFSGTRGEERFGSLPYMSPEQTGKMNRTVDARSDLYSLGVTFYQLLTGRCPFESTDPLELVHCHIAKLPAPPEAYEPSIPAPLSHLIMKLLQKEAEQRYQSAAGVLADLEQLRGFVQAGRTIPPELAMGTRDEQQAFRIPERLYGRRSEIEQLLHTFGGTAAGGFELVLVSGYSGVGKSALINEVQKPLVAARGFFAAGKYDQFDKARPYSAIQHALTELVRLVLRESDEVVAHFRGELLAALHSEGQCLIDVVPLLETLLGPQPELPEAAPIARQNRFVRNCHAALGVLATAEHPLVLFLDDMQWADAASLELVGSWIEKQIHHTMLILAYRDNEVGAHHPLQLMFDDKLRSLTEVCRIQLAPLAQEHVEELLSDALRRDPQDRALRALALVHLAKTEGNPFFLIQMLRGLHEEGLLVFAEGQWSWSLSEITARNLPDNVVELMTHKLLRYAPETCSALNLAAILGVEFALRSLAIVLQTTEHAAYKAILPAIEDGLLAEAGGQLRFLHDKIHEAAHVLVDAEERMRRQRLVGRHLLATLDAEGVEQQLFKIVENLNRSRALGAEPAELNELVRLNIRAGHKALAAAAFQQARELFEQAALALPQDAWKTQTALAFEAYLGLASANFACSRADVCARHASLCLEHVRDPVANAPAVQLLLAALFVQNRHQEAVALGVERLAPLGVHVPPRPSKAQVVAAYARFKWQQGRRSTASLIDLPAATDPRAIAAFKILNALSHSAYMVSSDLYGLLAMQMAQLSLRYGNTSLSPFGYAACMGTEAGAFKVIQSAQAYLRLAYAVNEKYPNPQQRGQIELIRCTVALHQTVSLEGWEQAVAAAVAMNLDAGAVNMADYTLAMTRAHCLFFGTRSLDDVYRQNLEVLRLHQKHGDPEITENQLLVLRTLASWREAGEPHGITLEPEVQAFDLEAYTKKLEAPGNIVMRGYLATLCQAERYLAGDFEGSLRAGLAFKVQALDLLGILVEHVHRYFFALAYLACNASQLSVGERAAAGAYYRVNRALFTAYDRNAPNFRSHVALLEAEQARRAGRMGDAMRLYERAMSEARGVSSFNELLACRRLAGLLREHGLMLEARWVAQKAQRVAGSLQFRAELRRIAQEFPDLSDPSDEGAAPSRRQGPNDSATSSPTFSLRLGVESLARGAQAISSQVKLEGLIAVLLRQLCQSSGAQRAVLLLQEDNALRVQGELVVGAQGAQLMVLGNIPFPAKRAADCLVAESLVRFVARVKRPELLDNASVEGEFTEDPYVQLRRPKSILCRPILNGGKLLGVLYLENNLAARAFTAEHQEVLEVLASQAAISIENARVYRELEQKVEERTAELRRKTSDLDNMLQNLDEGIFTILRDGTVHPEYSKQLESILGTRRVAGRHYTELLFSDSDVAPDVLSQVQAAVECSVGCELLWYESNRHLLVRTLHRRHPDGSAHALELNWSAIQDDSGKVEKLLVSVKDVTALRSLEQETQAQRRDLENHRAHPGTATLRLHGLRGRYRAPPLTLRDAARGPAWPRGARGFVSRAPHGQGQRAHLRLRRVGSRRPCGRGHLRHLSRARARAVGPREARGGSLGGALELRADPQSLRGPARAFRAHRGAGQRRRRRLAGTNPGSRAQRATRGDPHVGGRHRQQHAR